MLGKLMKYEFGALSRVLLPIYGAVLLLSGIGHFLMMGGDALTGVHGLFSGIFFFIYIVAIIAAVLLTFFLVLQRFYKSMVCDEGYLTHTLPVSMNTLICSKMLTAFIWVVIAVIVALISLVILLFTGQLGQMIQSFFQNFGAINETFQAESGISIKALTAFICIIGLLGVPAQILVFYASISIGQQIGKNKLLGSVAAYMIINVVTQLLSMSVLVVILLSSGDIAGFLDNTASAAVIVWPSMITAVVLQVAVGAVCWLLTTNMMKKHLNLE